MPLTEAELEAQETAHAEEAEKKRREEKKGDDVADEGATLRGNGRNTSSRHVFQRVQLRSGMFTAVLHTQSAVGPVLANGQPQVQPAAAASLRREPACASCLLADCPDSPPQPPENMQFIAYRHAHSLRRHFGTTFLLPRRRVTRRRRSCR